MRGWEQVFRAAVDRAVRALTEYVRGVGGVGRDTFLLGGF